MDELIQELNSLRIDREETTREYQDAIQANGRREREVLASIRQHRERTAQVQPNNRGRQRNPFKVGDVVRITNEYKLDELGTVGRITHVTNRMVSLRHPGARKVYSRAWWNVELVENSTWWVSPHVEDNTDAQ